MRRNYSLLEQKIINLMQCGTFFFEDVEYKVVEVDKPRTPRGECKTDVYVKAKDLQNKVIELKISVKTEGSNEFQGNKLTSKTALAYFGEGYHKIIASAAQSIQHKFESAILINIPGRHPTKPNSIVLGWKLEIANRPRALSVPIPLTKKEIRDYIYKGTNQPSDKRNATIKGASVKNAGVAEYIIETKPEKLSNAQDVIDQLEWIDTKEFEDTYLIFTANNYRTDCGRADGPRSLAVTVDWKVESGKLKPSIVYDQPLVYTGQNDIVPKLLTALTNFNMHGLFELKLNKAQVYDPEVAIF